MSPSASIHPSFSKLLITDPNTKSRPKPPPTAPPNSASSSSTAAAPPADKRTRDQPNFSDCHCCGCRINSTNPNDRLQPLDSFWRIVLLCRKCRRNVQSGKTCPYCFRGTGTSGEFLTCGACARKIHNECVSNFGNCTPWCYLSVGTNGFRVCVDCWVPELLKNSIRIHGRGGIKGGLKEKGDGEDLLENVVKKVKGRAKVGKNYVLGLPAKKPNSNSKESIEDADGDAEVSTHLHRTVTTSPGILRTKCVVKNSRDSDVSNIRGWNGLSYKRSRFRKNHGTDQNLGDSCINSTGLNLGTQCYKRDKTRKIWHLTEDYTAVSESTSSHPEEIECNLKSDDENNVDRLGAELLIYKRSRFKRKLFQVKGESRSLDTQGARLKPESCQLNDREPRIRCQVNSDDTKVILPSGSCDADRDRYHLVYCRRATGTKSDSSFMRFSTLLSQNQASGHALEILEVGFGKDRDCYHLKYAKRTMGTKLDSSFQHYDTFLSENKDSESAINQYVSGSSVKSDGRLILQMGTVNEDPDRYCLKYTKRVKGSKCGSISGTKLCSDAFVKEIETSAAGLTINCSAESRTPSDVTSDSFTIDLPK